MLPPSGEQFTIEAEGHRAVLTESGGALRMLTFHDRDLVDGFADDQLSSGGRGQLLMPWPNRIRDGRYTFDGATQQLALTEPSRHNASHGLARWATWRVLDHRPDQVRLGYRVMAQTGYPWTLDLQVEYALGADGLTVTQSATNRAATTAPYASGAHPYLQAGPGPVDGWRLRLPASTRLLTDEERLLPVGREDVTGTAYDFREAREIGDVPFNHAFTDLERDDAGRARVELLGTDGSAVELWVDEHHRWLLLYSADDVLGKERRSLAVEPMTSPVDAFSSGDDLVRLEPGQTFAASWGIRAR